MTLELATECWNYSRLLTYQLSSLVLYPPSDVDVTATVFYNDADARTCRILDFFSQHQVSSVRWNWRMIEKRRLFRRAIWRNIVALETAADWVFYTDCDQVFRTGCLDALTQLEAREEIILAFPRYVNCSTHLKPDDPIFQRVETDTPAIVDIDPTRFKPVLHTVACGGMQIVRADTLRSIGYCKDIPRFMKPAKRIGRTREDVAFRKTIGTDGTAIDLPHIYRIAHHQRGRRCWHLLNRL